jgi:hypothetical protein
VRTGCVAEACGDLLQCAAGAGPALDLAQFRVRRLHRYAGNS